MNNKHEAINTFSEGLISDLNPLTTPKNVLTDALNATILTFNGNEMILQNDLGNTDLIIPGGTDQVTLSEGFIPIGIKEYGGVVYIVSSNPTTNETELGSFPGPNFVDPIEKTDTKQSFGQIVNNESLPGIGIIYQLTNTVLRPGNIFKIRIPVNDSSVLTTYGVQGIRKYYRPRLINLNSNIDVTDRFITNSRPQWFNPTNDANNDIELIYPYDLKSGKLGLRFELEDLDYFALSNWVKNTVESGPNLPTLEIIPEGVNKYMLNFNTFDILEGSSFKCNEVDITYTITEIGSAVAGTTTTATFPSVLSSTDNQLSIVNTNTTLYRLIARIVGEMSSVITKTSNTSTSAVFSITDIVSNDVPILNRGICWSTTSSPTISDSRTSNGTGDANFTATVTGLTRTTLYYVRAYTTNQYTTQYSPEIQFTTSAILPSVTTSNVSEIGQTTASSGGVITSDGGSTILECGVCWGINFNPTIEDSRTINSATSGIFVSNIAGLSTNTNYYMRAYATNIIGTTYGNQINFYSLPLDTDPPILLTNYAIDLYNTQAYVNYTISSIGGTPITEQGVCWSTNHNPTIADQVTVDGNTTAGSYTTNIDSLNIPVRYGSIAYYIRAYATNSNGFTTYGNEFAFDHYEMTNILGIYVNSSSSNVINATATLAPYTNLLVNVIADNYIDPPYRPSENVGYISLVAGETLSYNYLSESINFNTYYSIRTIGFASNTVWSKYIQDDYYTYITY